MPNKALYLATLTRSVLYGSISPICIGHAPQSTQCQASLVDPRTHARTSRRRTAASSSSGSGERGSERHHASRAALLLMPPSSGTCTTTTDMRASLVRTLPARGSEEKKSDGRWQKAIFCSCCSLPRDTCATCGSMHGSERLFCSWCFAETEHASVSRGWLSRDVRRCSGCANETVRCVACPRGAARSYPDAADSRCYLCLHLVRRVPAPRSRPLLINHDATDSDGDVAGTDEAPQRRPLVAVRAAGDAAVLLEPSSEVELRRWCSWCLALTAHALYRHRTLFRSLYVVR